MKSLLSRLVAFSFIAATACANVVHAAGLDVMTSGGFTAAVKALAPAFTQSTGHTVQIVLGPSMGQSPQAIPNRLARGESADVVIMVGSALDALIKDGKVMPGSRVELADSRIGMVVRAGAPKPDISTVDALRKTLLEAKSIAYSDSASGVYIKNEMFRKLGIEDQVVAKARMIERIPVASVVANGDYEIGFQQVAELLPVAGVDFVGELPEQVQSVTRYAGGIPVGAKHPDEARALLQFLASAAAQPTVRKTGLDPVAP
jgi:molybdate transport system substrate-binding protein